MKVAPDAVFAPPAMPFAVVKSAQGSSRNTREIYHFSNTWTLTSILSNQNHLSAEILPDARMAKHAPRRNGVREARIVIMRATRVSPFDKLIRPLRVCASPHRVTGRRVPGAEGACRIARCRIACIRAANARCRVTLIGALIASEGEGCAGRSARAPGNSVRGGKVGSTRVWHARVLILSLPRIPPTI